ncbi:MAG TPA: hypothetical protein VFS36_13745 [Chitinophagaceae bacterium]|jgi:hypothetical protein|nr:hypothetical protein [Chitinophagaceae bacterium]
MQLKRISLWCLITGTLIIWTIKFIIRPFHLYDHSFQLLLGVAPNLLGAFLIPFGACWFSSKEKIRFSKFFRVTSLTDLRLLCLVGFVLLVINEYLQLIPVFHRTFDYLDILFSAVGLTVSYIVFGKLLSRKVVKFEQ